MTSLRLLPFILCLLSLLARGETVVTTTEQLAELCGKDTPLRVQFQLKGKVEALLSDGIILADQTGRIPLKIPTQTFATLQRGDQICANGTMLLDCGDVTDGRVLTCSASILSHASPPPPLDVPLRELGDARHALHYVRTTGMVLDAMNDDLDARWCQMLLQDGDNLFIVATPRGKQPLQHFKGARVSLRGVPFRHISGYREFSGPYLSLASQDDIQILSPPPEDSFDIPPLGPIRHLSPKEISSLGKRSVVGLVIAAWRGDHILLQTDWNKPILVRLSQEGNLPKCGTKIKVVGFPETDLAHINLVRADFKTLADGPFNIACAPPPLQLTADEMTLSPWHKRKAFNTGYRGKLVRLRGTVIGLPMTPAADAHLTLQSDGYIVPVYPGQTADCDVALNSVVEVTGVCMMETESWQPGMLFPRVLGHSVIMRDKSDLVVLSAPPWWTPQRLAVLIGVLIALLAAIMVWNRILGHLASKRGRELFDAQVDRLCAELRVSERTRLAAELHDSLAQNLSGISLEIDTAAETLDPSQAVTHRHLGIAARALKSCREDLRRCLWDLRNSALEESTMDAAIRKTLAPYVAGVDLAIRFNVPRERISDNTAHTILRIIRELVLNGIRHGGARKIQVAGAIEDDVMRFSVRDDGCGFDPELAPGFDEGHYGLLGIKERINEYEGSFTLSSKPGAGTKATISIKVPTDENHNG